MNDINRSSRNRDNLKRLNYPRQTYAFSGIDFGDADTPARINKKLNINAAPMVITPLPPGANAENDIEWKQTYGASMDCVMSLLDGKQYAQNVFSVNLEFLSTPSYKKALPIADNLNLYETINNKQQIHFIVGKDKVSDFRKDAANAIFGVEARSLGIRAPIQMCGWGKTIGMRPTDPDPVDPRVNDDEHKFDRSTWPIGPLDARWDDKRKTWRAFNDLIADDASQNLGTFVFSTNPDDVCGFPFLRGKIEDVWSVRRTFREVGSEAAGKKDDTTKTAMVTTKLEGYAYQNNKVAPWSDALVIFDGCFEGNALNGTCGTEKTSEGSLAVNAAANFFLNPLKVGPIVFSAIPAPDNVIKGQMYYDGVGSCGQWAPGIEFDFCEVAAPQMNVFFNNDKAIAEGVIALCNFITGGGDNDKSKDLLEAIDKNRDWILENTEIDLEDATWSIEFASVMQGALLNIENWSWEMVSNVTDEIQQAAGGGILALQGQIQGALGIVQNHLVQCINTALISIATQLAENCGCFINPILCESLPVVLQPIMTQPPDVQPGIILQPVVDEIENNYKAGMEAEVIEPLNELIVVISTSQQDDEDESPPEAVVQIEITNPCDDNPLTATEILEC